MGDRTESPTDEQCTDVDRTGTDGAIEAIGSYEAADGVVLYDTENPLAWVQGDNAIRLAKMA